MKLKGWGNAIAWSPQGKSLTVAVHNSTLIRVEFDNNFMPDKRLLSVYRNLPFTSLFYSDENTLVGCGYDMLPLVFKYEQNKWVLKGACEKQSPGGFLIKVVYSAVEKLARDKELEVLAKSRETKPEFKTVHFTNIISHSLLKASDASTVITGDLKGNILVWKLSDMRAIK